MTLPSPRSVRLGLDSRILRQRGEGLGIDTHGKDAEPDFSIGHLHPVDVYREPQNLGERGSEVPEIRRGVEADEVGAEQSPEQPIPLGQGPEQLFGRKGYMKEEADPGVGQPAAEELGKQQELIVVDPDEVARLVMLGDHIGESFVDLYVGLPVAHVKRDLVDQIMEEGPENPVGKAFVVPGHLVFTEGHGHQAHVPQLLFQLGLLL